MEEGQIRRLDPECLAYCLMGIGDFLDMYWVLWDGEVLPEEAFENVMAFIRYGIDLRTARRGLK